MARGVTGGFGRGMGVLAASCLLALAAAAAQTVPTTETSPPEPALRRILHTRDGRWLRGLARPVEGGFEVRGGDRWKLVATEAIESARLERDVLAEKRALERRVPDSRARASPKLRVALARWMLAHGLVPESFEELDRVLARDPDQKDALALVAEAPPSSDLLGDLPTDRTGLIRAGARAHGTAREFAVARLAQRADKDELSSDLARELASGVDARREFATLALRRMFPGVYVKDLAVHAVVDSVFDVRKGAALALRDARDPRACALVSRALASSSGVLRQRAVEALGDMGYAEAIEPLVLRMVAAQSNSSNDAGRVPHGNIFVGEQIAYVKDFDVQVAQAASIAKPVVGVLTVGSVLDVGVIGVTEYGPDDESIACCRALRKLTGEPMGADAGAWKRWWDGNRARFGHGENETTTQGGAPPEKRND
jgi:hypothetical protein